MNRRRSRGHLGLLPGSTPESKDWYRIISVLLNNGPSVASEGDSVGVAISWEWPDPLDGITGSDFEAAAFAIHAGRWKENIQAKDWVGYPIAKALSRDLDNKADKAEVKGLVAIWIEGRNLVVVEEKDDHRELKKFVRVASDE
jgi:hypothetical protein